jgi:hypothetical protein
MTINLIKQLIYWIKFQYLCGAIKFYSFALFMILYFSIYVVLFALIILKFFNKLDLIIN